MSDFHWRRSLRGGERREQKRHAIESTFAITRESDVAHTEQESAPLQQNTCHDPPSKVLSSNVFSCVNPSLVGNTSVAENARLIEKCAAGRSARGGITDTIVVTPDTARLHWQEANDALQRQLQCTLPSSWESPSPSEFDGEDKSWWGKSIADSVQGLFASPKLRIDLANLQKELNCVQEENLILRRKLKSSQECARSTQHLVQDLRNEVHLLRTEKYDLESKRHGWFCQVSSSDSKVAKAEKCIVELKKKLKNMEERKLDLEKQMACIRYEFRQAKAIFATRERKDKEAKRALEDQVLEAQEECREEKEKIHSLELKHRALLVETASGKHEHLTSTFPSTAAIADLVAVLESDLSGLLLEFVAPYRVNDGRLFNEQEAARLVSEDAHSLLAFFEHKAFGSRKSMVLEAVGNSVHTRALCQRLWTLLFPVELMAQTEVDSFVLRSPSDSVWKREWDKPAFRELTVSCSEQYMRILACSFLSNASVEIAKTPSICAVFDQEYHKSIGSAIRCSSECFIVFPSLQCETGLISKSLVLSSSDLN